MKAHWIKLLAVAVITIAVVAPGIATATPPTLNITTPTGTIYLPGPGVVPISLTVAHTGCNPAGGLRCLTQFDIQVDSTSIIGGQVNPFTNTDTCTGELINVTDSCSTNNLDFANVTKNWTVTVVPSTHTIYVKAKHTNDLGVDEEEVNVQLLEVEYPAPPAVANAYINSQGSAIRKLFTGGVRGCIISQIAEEHAKYEAYGPKGGPYDEGLIKTDVQSFSIPCGGPAF